MPGKQPSQSHQSTKKSTKKLLALQVNSVRPYKSRSKRPCDFCRRRKTCCIIKGSIPCMACIQFNGGVCTFLEQPMKRSQREEGPQSQSSKKRNSFYGNLSQYSLGLSHEISPTETNYSNLRHEMGPEFPFGKRSSFCSTMEEHGLQSMENIETSHVSIPSSLTKNHRSLPNIGLAQDGKSQSLHEDMFHAYMPNTIESSTIERKYPIPLDGPSLTQYCGNLDPSQYHTTYTSYCHGGITGNFDSLDNSLFSLSAISSNQRLRTTASSRNEELHIPDIHNSMDGEYLTMNFPGETYGKSDHSHSFGLRRPNHFVQDIQAEGSFDGDASGLLYGHIY